METFTKLFGSMLVFVFHCFDRNCHQRVPQRIARPEQVVHFVRAVFGIPVVGKEVLSRRTNDYRNWVESYARNHNIPIDWAEKGVRKESYVLPAQRRMEKRKAFGVYFIFKTMEQGRTFRSACRSIPRRSPTTASWRIRPTASPITTSTSGTRL
jgi:hypothetical protein